MTFSLPHPSERATGVKTALFQKRIPDCVLPKKRRRMRTVDFNLALQLQKKGLTMREISETLNLPYVLVVDDLYWDART